MHYLSRSIAFFGFRNRRPGAFKKEGHFCLENPPTAIRWMVRGPDFNEGGSR
jgi:hypothetical protein